MFMDNHLDFIKTWHEQPAEYLRRMWNERCDTISDDTTYIKRVGKCDIDATFPKASDYAKAVAEGRYNPSDTFYYFENGTTAITFSDLNNPKSPFSKEKLLEWLRPKAVEDAVMQTINEHIDGNQLCVMWNEYCQDMGKTDFVFPNPNEENDEMPWVGVSDGRLAYFDYADDGMAWRELAGWVIQHKPEKWVYILNDATKEVNDYIAKL